MALVRDRDTAPELIVRTLLHSLGFRYRLHVGALSGCPDLVFPRLHKIIFVHGCFWHQHSCKRGNRRPKSNRIYWNKKLKRNIARDSSNKKILRRQGWSILVIWECHTKSSKLDQLQNRVLRFLNN
jgi:DNA mismatch endonuclease, patch repair protein